MAIDRRYREEIVDVFVSRHRDRCLGALGHERQVAPVRLTRLEVTYEGRPKITGLQVISLNDGYFKLGVFTKIVRGANVEDSWLISQDSTEEYCSQVLSEELITLPSGRQRWTQRRKDNHALDCEKLNLALAHWLNFRLLRDPVEQLQSKAIRKTTQASEFRNV